MNRKEKLELKDTNRCIELIQHLPEAEYKALRQSTTLIMLSLVDLGAGVQMVSIEDLVRAINIRGKK